MTKATILLADDNIEFLATRAEWLEREGYRVIRASNPVEARKVLEVQVIDVAVLDLRLENGQDSNDLSGLTIAKEVARSVPKIILTAYPDLDTAQEALGIDLRGLPAAANFMSKDRGFADMLSAIDNALRLGKRYEKEMPPPNMKLKIAFRGPTSFRDWVRRFAYGNMSGEMLDHQAQELETLVKILYRHYSDVILEDIQTGRSGEARALVTSADDSWPGRCLLKIWSSKTMEAEQNALAKYGQRIGDWWTLRPNDWQGLSMFGGASFGVLNPDREPYLWLIDYIRLHREDNKLVNAALDNLLESTKRTLYVEFCEPDDTESLNAAYRRIVGLDKVQCEDFQRTVVEALETLNHQYLVNSQVGMESVIFTDRHGVTHEGVDPSELAFGDQLQVGPPVLRRHCLGNMDGFNVLLDREGKVILTDFGTIGPAPALSDYVALEAKIRFDWFKPEHADSLFGLESALQPSRRSRTASRKVKTGVGAQKTLTMVRTVRSHAQQQVEADPIAYQLGLFFHSARRVMMAETREQRAHALLAASLLAKWLNEALSSDQPMPDA